MTADTDVQYETHTVQTLRGTEAKSIAKWEADGWELISQTPGRIRTQLVFRRPKPKTPWRMYAIIGGVLVVIAIIIVIGSVLSSGAAEPKESPSASAAAPSDEPSSEPSEEPSDEPSDVSSAAPAVDTPLTIASSPDLAALLTSPDSVPASEAFAQKYAGQLIEFDGAIGAMNNHDGYTTRYDILIVNGDYSETHSNGGPTFQFRDVNITSDLNLTGDVPDTIGVGTNVHVIVRVGEYDPNNMLFQLEPVETRVL
ncbi:DUF4839 domain-containing protein [Microbacterium murale]|uniref:DUF4839 domain-containing protein n=1 Tax=Microbacterium murale TaxID=1081040 RepID=A0ABQ1RP97_9MICO|nr:DUF4839 domain-containing protein [Microbacterium murale]GGD76843.1 hypothetical protein GCM10007269_19710 [Microbacterium murale]